MEFNQENNSVRNETIDLKLTKNLDNNLEMLRNIFRNDETIIFRSFKNINNDDITFCIIYVQPMVDKKEIENHIIKPINEYKSINVSNENFLDSVNLKIINSFETSQTDSLNFIIDSIVYGKTALIISGESSALIIDTIGWSSRAIEEPPSETVVRGPREGFTEAINTNITLLRRRILTPDLKFQFKTMRSRTKTKICICYIDGLAQKDILNELNKRLDGINIDGVLESSYIEELIRDEPLSPFRTLGNTERPDVVAAKLLEGRIAIICDGTPVVLTLPFLFIEFFQINEDYYYHFTIASVFRFIRWLGFFLASSVPAIYISLVNFNHELIPTQLLISIMVARQGVPFPTIVEALLMLFTFEILREAGSRIPKPIGSAVSIVGALILGDAAVNAKLISAPMVVISAATGISGFLLPKMMSLFIIRVVFILFASLLGLYGYIFAVIILALHLMSIRSFGVPYMLNIGTGVINAGDIKDTAIRAPLWLMKNRNNLSRINVKSTNKTR